MPSPTKKRKLNSDAKSSLPSRGLEYFFAKQRDRNGTGSALRNENEAAQDAVHPVHDHEMTDEELARKLQAEWDQEEAGAAVRDTTAPDGKKPRGSSILPQTLQLTKEEHDPDRAPSEPPKPNIAETSRSGKGKGTLSLQSVAASIDTVSELIPFDESPLTFDPSQYIPQLRDHWAKDGGNASYALLTRCFVLVSGTSSRIKIVDTLVNCLRILIEGDPESLLPAVGHESLIRHSLFTLLLLHSLRSCLKCVVDLGLLTTTRSGYLPTPFHPPTYP